MNIPVQLPPRYEQAVPILERFLQESSSMAQRLAGGRQKRPYPPRDLQIAVGTLDVTISWTKPPKYANITGWRVYKDNESNLIDKIPDPNTLQAKIKLSLASATAFYVSAVNAIGQESIKVQVIGTPTGVTAGTVTYNDGQTIQSLEPAEVGAEKTTGKSLDILADGATYGRPLLSRLNTGKPWIDFSEAIHANKILDNIADGATYGRPLLLRLNVGKPWIDFSETIHANKNVDNVADGASFKRVQTGTIAARPVAGTAGRIYHSTDEGVNGKWYRDTGTAWVQVGAGVVDDLAEGVYGRSLASRLSSGKPLIDFSETIHLNKNLGNVPDDAGSGRRAIVKGSSTALNEQGSIIPSATPGGIFTLISSVPADGALVAGMNATWAATNPAGYRPDGSSVSAPASSTIPILAAPTVSQQAGGSRAARTLFVRVALIKAGCILSISDEVSIAINASNVLVVTSPATQSGYDGWLPMFSTQSARENVPTDLNAAGNSGKQTPIAFGVNYTEPNTTPAGPTSDGALAVFLGSSTAGPSLVTSGAGTGWTTPNNITLDDGVSFATELIATSVTTAALKGTFGAATRVPTNAIITGIKVTLKRKSSSSVAPGLETSAIALLGVAGAVSKSSLVDWTTSLTQEAYGGNGDLWGLAQITPAQVNASGFGFSITVINNDTVSRTASVDAFYVTIYYSTGGLTGVYTGNLAVSTTYSTYPSYDSQIGTFLFANGNAAGAGDPGAAAAQAADGRFQVQTSRLQFTSPAASVGGGSSTSTGGGGRYTL